MPPHPVPMRGDELRHDASSLPHITDEVQKDRHGLRSGLTGFVAGLARQPRLASRNVTLNNLLPGAFDTERLQKTMAAMAAKAGRPLASVSDQRRLGIPAQRFGAPDEFGALCAFVCSAHAGYITGQNLLVDGGAYPGSF